MQQSGLHYVSILLSALGFLFWVQVSSVSAADETTYGCDEESNYKIAKVGVYSGNTVTVDEDSSERACRFSVNGANVESPDQETVIGAINRIRSGAIRELTAENQRHLAYLTISASPMNEPRRDLLELFKEGKQQLENCFGGGAGGDGRLGFSFSCRVITPTTSNGPHTKVRIPTLEIVVNYPTARRTRTYIPVHTIGSGRPPLPLHLR